MTGPVSIQSLTSALRLFTAIPEGYRAAQVRRAHQGSVYLRGMFVIVDPADTKPVHGGDYLVQWDEVLPPSIIGAREKHGYWFVGPAGGGHSQVMGEERIVMVDGPYPLDGLRSKLLGRVVGYLGHECGRPIEALWPDTGMDGPSRDTVGLGDFPDQYCATGDGTCLEPVYPHGARFHMTAIDAAKPGDYVVVYRKPDLTRRSHRQAMIKRLVTPLPEGWTPSECWTQGHPMPPVVLLEAHNPPRTYAVPADEIMAVHKCLGLYDGPTFKVTKDEARALAAQQRAERGAA